MKHATPATLKELTPLLDQLRSFQGLLEKSPGSFYRKSKAFCHFHEDPLGIFVDVRLRPTEPFSRLRVTTPRERATFVAEVKRSLAG
jgi:hypothetical protein